jgi:hypothetical protein
MAASYTNENLFSLRPPEASIGAVQAPVHRFSGFSGIAMRLLALAPCGHPMDHCLTTAASA